MHKITHIQLEKIPLSWKILHWRRGQRGRLISAVVVPTVIRNSNNSKQKHSIGTISGHLKLCPRHHQIYNLLDNHLVRQQSPPATQKHSIGTISEHHLRRRNLVSSFLLHLCCCCCRRGLYLQSLKTKTTTTTASESIAPALLAGTIRDGTVIIFAVVETGTHRLVVGSS